MTSVLIQAFFAIEQSGTIALLKQLLSQVVAGGDSQRLGRPILVSKLRCIDADQADSSVIG